MLTIDEKAAEAIKTIVRESELPAGAGLRIEARIDDVPQPELTVSVEELPVPGDEVVAKDDARVFLPPAAAAYLDNKILHADDDDVAGLRFVVQST